MKLCVWRGWSSSTSLSSPPGQYYYSPIKCSSSPSGPALRRPSAARIGRRWAEYQGADDWARLLDPLDDTLRSEILRYGEFARAAYASFDFDPRSPTHAACRFPKHSLLRRSGIPSTGYRVTRNLHATTAAELPPWLARAGAPPRLSRRSSWIGYVAVCRDEAEIARLGRRDVVIAFRGTATFLEWVENSRTFLTSLDGVPPAPPSTSDGLPEPMVERGFWNLFTTAISPHGSLRSQVRDEVERLVGDASGDAYPLSLTVTGHSLGAALAVLAAHDIAARLPLGGGGATVTAISFGGPRIGNAGFRRRVEESGCKVLRIVNAGDVVTKVPGFAVEPEKAEGGRGGGGGGWGWWRRATEELGWAYADVGRELRLRGGRGAANLVECHDLGLYLDQVNQLSAACR